MSKVEFCLLFVQNGRIPDRVALSFPGCIVNVLNNLQSTLLYINLMKCNVG